MFLDEVVWTLCRESFRQVCCEDLRIGMMEACELVSSGPTMSTSS